MKWAVVGSGPTGHTENNGAVTAVALMDRTVIAVDTAGERVCWDYWLRSKSVKAVRKEKHLTVVRSWDHVDYVGEILDCRKEWDWTKFPLKWAKGTYLPWNDPIGPHAIMYAVNHGATEIEVWGFEGARSWMTKHAEANTKRLQLVIDSADIPIVFHGKLKYDLKQEHLDDAHLGDR